MKQIVQDSITKLKQLIEKKENGFVECRSFAEQDVIEHEMKNHNGTCFNEVIHRATTGMIPMQPLTYPFVIRFGQGVAKDIMFKPDYKGLSISPMISGFVTGELLDKHSWKYWNSETYDVGAKQLRDDWHEFHEQNSETPFDACFECGKKFEDDEVPYAGVFSERYGYRIRCLCKECAYRISLKVGEYYVADDGTVTTEDVEKR